jgi:hypothetical protein
MLTFQARDPSTKQEKSRLEKLWISTPDKSNIEGWNWKNNQLYCCYPIVYPIFEEFSKKTKNNTK